MSQLKSLRIFSRSKSYLAQWNGIRRLSLPRLLERDQGSDRVEALTSTHSYTREGRETPGASTTPSSTERLASQVRRGWPVLLDPGQCVGVEIESEGIRRFDVDSNLWELKRDDSLRGEFRLEAVTRPLCGDALLYALYCYEHNARRFTDPFSWRCSTHLHFNLLELTPQEVASLALITFAADNYFYAAGAEARRENYNCRPLSLLIPTAETLGEFARRMSRGHATRAVDGLRDREGGIHRYAGMNWFAIRTFGTLEIRHFPGSADMRQIVRWINLGTRLIHAARTYSMDDVVRLIDDGENAFGRAIFGDEWRNLAYDNHEQDWTEVLEGAEHLLACYRTNTESATSLDGILRQNMVIR